MPINIEQKRKLYALYEQAHETFGRPSKFEGGDVDSCVTCTGTLTIEELKLLIEHTARISLKDGPPTITVDGYGVVRASWHRSVPPPGPEWTPVNQ